jgi:mediator of RNA polymerase II transcription subunit 7
MADQQAEEQQQAQMVWDPRDHTKAPFPAPPPFWKHFTTENLTRLNDLKSSSDGLLPKLPFELAVLRPPPPPTAGEYKTFERPNQVNPRADPPPDDILLFNINSPRFNPAVMLTRLTKSIMLNFLELITIMTENPTERTEKIQDIRRLMINVHAVINVYRPHQARESVRERLQGMLEDGEREMEQCDEAKEKVKDFLAELESTKDAMDKGEHQTNGAEENGDLGQVDDQQLREARRLWGMIHEIAGE